MAEQAQLPTTSVDVLSSVHGECEKEAITKFIETSILDNDGKYQHKLKVCIKIINI